MTQITSLYPDPAHSPESWVCKQQENSARSIENYLRFIIAKGQLPLEFNSRTKEEGAGKKYVFSIMMDAPATDWRTEALVLKEFGERLQISFAGSGAQFKEVFQTDSPLILTIEGIPQRMVAAIYRNDSENFRQAAFQDDKMAFIRHYLIDILGPRIEVDDDSSTQEPNITITGKTLAKIIPSDDEGIMRLLHVFSPSSVTLRYTADNTALADIIIKGTPEALIASIENKDLRCRNSHTVGQSRGKLYQITDHRTLADQPASR